MTYLTREDIALIRSKVREGARSMLLACSDVHHLLDAAENRIELEQKLAGQRLAAAEDRVALEQRLASLEKEEK